MKHYFFIPVMIVACLNGCFFGPRQEDFAGTMRRTMRPGGSLVSVRGGLFLDVTPPYLVVGELIAVDPDGLVLIALLKRDEDAAAQDRLVFVAYSLIESVTAEGQNPQDGLQRVSLASGRRPDTGELEQLRRLSRYPYGLNEEAKARLLAQFGQDTIHEMKPSER